ncbi:MAG: N-acetyltransferase [Marinilabiliaceae bacterium]|nr:N-acetyltransferase [Marinilabiliaceae bacterium]
MSQMIRNAKPEDARAICAIYNHHVLHTIVTFEEAAVSIAEMQERIQSTTIKWPWIVYEEEGRVSGYAYASEWKSRCAYKHSLESTIYLAPEATGKGIGTGLYKDLLDRLDQLEIHAVIGGISLPNEASIGLHEKLGFEKIGQFKEVGNKFNQWIDVGYWELLFK